jgi:[acyl-carrier-protein] S-malonyltransferase
MIKLAFLFDGQGAFKPGIGKELYNKYRKAREVIDKSSEFLKYDLKKYLWGEEASKTSGLTSIAQPAISAVSLAYAEILREMKITAEVSLGHSLGEATAVVYCGAVAFGDGIKIIKKRGEVMEKGGKEGGMMAILNLDVETLQAECRRVSAETGEPVVVANVNTPNQVVISGSREGIKKIAVFTAQNKGRGIPLDVGGAWHSPYLKEASVEFTHFLETIEFKDPVSKFYSVVDQKILTEGETIGDSLKRQMLSPVNWVKAIESLRALGYTTFVEIGPGKILKDLVARIDPDLRIEASALYSDLEMLVKNL